MNEDKIIQKLIEHDEQLQAIRESMATKGDISRITETLDKAMSILKRLDEDRLFTAEWVKRVESVVENHTSAIKQIKEQLKVA